MLMSTDFTDRLIEGPLDRKYAYTLYYNPATLSPPHSVSVHGFVVRRDDTAPLRIDYFDKAIVGRGQTAREAMEDAAKQISARPANPAA